MPRPVPTFKGKLITLRPPDPQGDAPDYFQFNLDPDMHVGTGNDVLRSEAEARAELERFVALEDISTWMSVDNQRGRVVGRFFLDLKERDGLRIVGEGNRVAKPYWRKGYNREARRLLFRYVFEELWADMIETGTWEDNVNSVKSIESYGFEFEREERRWNDKHGRLLTMRYYTLTREQWQAGSGKNVPGE